MNNLLIIGPDSTLQDTHALAVQIHPRRRVEMHFIPSKDYYDFDLTGLTHFPSSQWDVCIAVNEFYINDVRRALHQQLAELGYAAISLVSPHAHVHDSATIGENTIVHAGCFVGARTVIGHHCVLRPNVALGEDVKIGKYVTLEANVSLRELCMVGDFSTICANSSLARATSIGSHCYLNLSRQYVGTITPCTFYSPAFQNPIQIFSS